MADDMNNAIRTALGQPSTASGSAGNQSPSIPSNTVALRNIVTNGTLLNQNISRLIQTINDLRTAWGG